jgi:hypothetical protein
MLSIHEWTWGFRGGVIRRRLTLGSASLWSNAVQRPQAHLRDSQLSGMIGRGGTMRTFIPRLANE